MTVTLQNLLIPADDDHAQARNVATVHEVYNHLVYLSFCRPYIARLTKNTAQTCTGQESN
jgi:hypothetical protein